MERIVEYKFTKEDIQKLYKRHLIGKIDGIKFFQRPIVLIVIFALLLAIGVSMFVAGVVNVDTHIFLSNSSYSQENEILINRLGRIVFKFGIVFTVFCITFTVNIIVSLIKNKKKSITTLKRYAVDVKCKMNITDEQIILENVDDKITIRKKDMKTITKDEDFLYIISGKYKIKAIPVRFISDDILKYLVSYL